MSLLSSSELPATATPDRKNPSALVENAVAFGFLTTVGIAMTGWLFLGGDLGEKVTRDLGDDPAARSAALDAASRRNTISFGRPFGGIFRTKSRSP
jgi:hypothetical protein